MLWLQHPKVSTKFYAIALAFLAPVVLLGYLFVDQSLKDIRFADRERDGAAYLAEAWPLFQDAVAGREPTAERLSSAAEADDGLVGAAARQRFLDAPPGQARIEAGQDFIQKIADSSWLTLDPDLDSYYVMDAVTVHFPEVAAALRALTDAANRQGPLRDGAGREGSALSLAADRLLRSDRALRNSIETGADGNPDGTIRAALTVPLGGVLAAVDRFARAAASADPPAPAAAMAAGRGLQADLDALWRTGRGELDRLLRLRAERLEHKLAVNLALAGALVLTVLLLMAAISHSIARRLDETAATMDAMRAGHLERVVPNLDGRDEIGAIARVLEVFRERLISLRAFEGDLIAQEASSAAGKAAESRFREILDLSPIGVVIVSKAGTPLYCNASFATILGADRADLAQRNIDDIWADTARLKVNLQRGAMVRDLETVLKRPDGGTVTCLMSGEPIHYDGQAAALRWAYDITERQKSEAEIRRAQARLVQSEKLASLGQLTAGIAHEIKNPLNFVNNFADLSTDLVAELRDALKPVALDDDVRTEVDTLTGLIGDNLDKVVQHGKRADSIVRNMLLHSREGSGERRDVDFNAVVREALDLAYHGARAAKPGFNVTLNVQLDPAAGEVELCPQEFTRVLLNLMSNGFYAVDERRRSGFEANYEATLAVTTLGRPDAVEVRISDNGVGIPPHVRAKLFTPFFTTKPPGEGTGLGLSLSHDIVVKQHGGTIDLQSEPGRGTAFIVAVPRRPATELRRVS